MKTTRTRSIVFSLKATTFNLHIVIHVIRDWKWLPFYHIHNSDFLSLFPVSRSIVPCKLIQLILEASQSRNILSIMSQLLFRIPSV